MRRQECKLFITSVSCRLSPISGSYFSRCLFLKGIFEFNVSYRCNYSWWLHCDYAWHGILLDRSVAGPKAGDYSWHGTTPGTGLLLARDAGSNMHAAIFTMLLMSISNCTVESNMNPTHLNVVTVFCFSSPRWFVHSFFNIVIILAHHSGFALQSQIPRVFFFKLFSNGVCTIGSFDCCCQK